VRAQGDNLAQPAQVLAGSRTVVPKGLHVFPDFCGATGRRGSITRLLLHQSPEYCDIV